ncbi:MAG TPA: hypothetical protein ENJ08_12875 [Gammaproteobacteria bacterium]|nr:hypothetical protein [Gammaproteobacteria bacterium]
MPESTQQELTFSVNSHRELEEKGDWYQENADITFPLMIIAIGAFQYILRKWIIPVSDDLLSEIENQTPSQALMFNPKFGVVLMIAGAILLLVFNIYRL